MMPAEWLERFDVSFDWSATGYHRDADGWEHQRFTLELTHGADRVEIPWRQGLGVDDDPTPDSTLPAVSSDARYGGMTWEEFAGEFGYDTVDARLSDFRTWEACRDLAGQLERFCGNADMFAAFLELEEAE